jgi:DNA sulfur modification protein DndE
MKQPVDHVRLSAKDKDTLIRIKKRTGLEHWNELCRIAYCRSLANPSPLIVTQSTSTTALDIEWKTFAGNYHNELSSITTVRAHQDNIDINSKEALASYFKAHLERGIASMQRIKSLADVMSDPRP